MISLITNNNLMSCDPKTKKKRFLIKGTEKYDKITYRDKILLLKKVLIDREQIKETSHLLNINYSTAKTFLRKFRNKCTRVNADFIQNVCQWFQEYRNINVRCAYRALTEEQEGARQPEVDAETGRAGVGLVEGSVSGSGQKMFANQQSKVEIIQQVLFE